MVLGSTLFHFINYSKRPFYVHVLTWREESRVLRWSADDLLLADVAMVGVAAPLADVGLAA